jgi:hypothetical protein
LQFGGSWAGTPRLVLVGPEFLKKEFAKKKSAPAFRQKEIGMLDIS